METTDPGFPASEPVENQGPQEPKIVQSGKHRQLSLQQINEVTWKVTDGRGSLVPASHGQWAGHHTTRAVAWLMGIGNGMWVVRFRNKSSRPMKLPAAKKYAVEMVRGIRPGRVIDDPVRELNRMASIVESYSSRANREAAR